MYAASHAHSIAMPRIFFSVSFLFFSFLSSSASRTPFFCVARSQKKTSF
jgi:hypothetical protein